MSRIPRPVVATVIVATVVAFAPGRAEASPYDISVDPRTGSAEIQSVVACTPGDDVEIDIYLSQRARSGFAEIFFNCPATGYFLGVGETSVDGSDPLHPGRAEVYIVRRTYSAASGFNDVSTSTERHSLSLRPRG